MNSYQRMAPFVEIMDSTLRDGEQTNGVSFLPHEKLVMARKLLYDVNVDRIEVASARVSEGEREAVTRICAFAKKVGLLERVEVLGFVDGGKSVDWIKECGGRVINLLAKGSLKHCTQQLRKTPEMHISDIRREVEYAVQQGLSVNLYLEDWSNGMKDSPEYVYQLMDALTLNEAVPEDSAQSTQAKAGAPKGTAAKLKIQRFMLPDTLGVMNPLQVIEYFRKMLKRYPDVHFDFHAHNDYDLAVSNSLAAVLSGARGLHVTVNGLGERCGNAPMASVQAILKDQFHAKTSIVENQLNDLSRMVESFSGITVAPNQPIVGDNVFTQVAGVHADGDNKDNLYCNELVPERFGRSREYALGKNSGKANIALNLQKLGLELTPDQMAKVTRRITELGERKEIVTQEDLPYIVNDVLKHAGVEEIEAHGIGLDLQHTDRLALLRRGVAHDLPHDPAEEDRRGLPGIHVLRIGGEGPRRDHGEQVRRQRGLAVLLLRRVHVNGIVVRPQPDRAALAFAQVRVRAPVETDVERYAVLQLEPGEPLPLVIVQIGPENRVRHMRASSAAVFQHDCIRSRQIVNGRGIPVDYLRPKGV